VEENTIIYQKEPDFSSLRDPIMIVGLPGVGHVGKFVADHLVEVLASEKIADIYSVHFPPQVLVKEDSTVDLAGNRLYLAAAEKRDILLLVGDSQSTDPAGHYRLCDIYIDFAVKFGVKYIYTLGGYPTGPTVSENFIIGAANNVSLIEALKERDIRFNPAEPPGGIVGASGLILAFAKFHNIDAVCLMGTTTGYIADPKSAKYLLIKLCEILDMQVDFTALDEKVKNMEQIVEKIRDSVAGEEIENYPYEPAPDDDLVYFG
jgi:uncharacterized protein (TIGR00162 family)